ncbi:zinc finger protein 678 [Colias croceus]|uniref:zinc finger protein 678 n=1 Tax=Colias crocea TaxID=72248 RepID=UPI001E281A40|nr:zinc finger protein 678 [Colias croceus]
MAPKRGRGRPRKLPASDNLSTKLAFEENDGTIENNSKQVMERVCSICDKTFESKLALIEHLIVCNENSNNSLNCEQDSSNESPKRIHREKKFIKNHEDKPKLCCTKCDKVFIFQKCFIKHMENDHSEAPNSVSCDMCDVTCPNKQILLKHIKKKHDPGSYSCEYCGKKFVRKAHVSRHLSQKGCDGRDLLKFSCEICDTLFTRKDNLMMHLRQQHITKGTYLCKQCNYFTRNFSKLIVHSRNHHQPKPLRFECDHCGKVMNSRASISKHLEIHGDKKYLCGVCGYRTYTIEVMRRHTLTHVDNKPYKCNSCDRSFIQRSLLVRHLEKHIGFTCKICLQRFDDKNELIRHKHSHKSDDELNCTFEDCDKQNFKNAAELERHIKEHLTDHKCEICGKTFKNEITLGRHVTTHALDRPRRCMYCVCARAYLRGEHLLRHVRNHHADVFKQRLMHVRKVLGSFATHSRVSKSELEAILNVLDAESDRIIEDFGTGVLYGGLLAPNENETILEMPVKTEPSPLLGEEDLADNLKLMLSKLIDKDLLAEYGWPNDSVDDILERVIENCGARVAEREKWSRVQRLRENAKRLFLYVIEDTNIAKMLSTHTIDQVIVHILERVSED